MKYYKLEVRKAEMQPEQADKIKQAAKTAAVTTINVGHAMLSFLDRALLKAGKALKAE